MIILVPFLIMWPVGYFLALMITGGVAKKWWTKLLQAVLGFIIGAAFLGCLYLDQKEDARQYNEGICSECNGEYKFSSAAGKGLSRRYYYSCADCDHTIEVESIQN